MVYPRVSDDDVKVAPRYLLSGQMCEKIVHFLVKGSWMKFGKVVGETI